MDLIMGTLNKVEEIKVLMDRMDYVLIPIKIAKINQIKTKFKEKRKRKNFDLNTNKHFLTINSMGIKNLKN